MIYVTHDQVEAMTLADRIAVMKDGVIQQVGTPREVYDRPANLFVAGFLGSPSMNFIAGRLRLDGGPTFTSGDFALRWQTIHSPRRRAKARSSSASGPSTSSRQGRRPRAADRDGRADGQRRARLEPARRHAAFAAPAGRAAPRAGD